MRSATIAFVALLFGATLSAALDVPSPDVGEYRRSFVDIDLGGADWSLTNANGTVALNQSCRVPGDVYGDLMDNGVIGNPFWRYGDETYRWIAYDNWTYSRVFPIHGDLVLSKSVVLVVEGMQVVTTIWINGLQVGSTTDQFQRYEFDVTDSFQNVSGQTAEIVVRFTSSVQYATHRHDMYPGEPKPNAPAYLWGLPHRNFIRAEQSSFGWDWGPAFAPQGIYKPIFLRAFAPKRSGFTEAVAIRHVTPHIFPLPFNQSVTRVLNDTDNEFWVRTYVYYSSVGEIHQGASVELRAPTLSCYNTTATDTARSDEADGTSYVVVDCYVANVRLWWPHGYGDQVQHEVAVRFLNANGTVLDFQTIRVGIRSVELITFGDPLSYRPTHGPTGSTNPPGVLPEGDAEGGDDRPVMFFRVNGMPIFAKGANLVPFHAFQSRVNYTFMEDILDSAIDANMNMIRVWGGGIFPLDSFYDMADEKGLLLWQEMIFACAQYPIDGFFLGEVRSEIAHQLRRLGRHSSIAIWSGNNENGVYDEGPGSPYEVLDYGNVMYEVIRQDTSRPVWPSSPSTGYAYGVTPSGLPAGTMEHPLPFKAGGRSGDSHYYNYFSCPNVSLYPKTNFGSEYGFQSLPWLPSFERISEPQDWSLFSAFMHHRQHHPQGNQQIAALLTQNFQIPDLNSTALDVFKRVIYLTQIQQTLCIADEGSYYRRGRNMPYRTMGSLYWQLNQNWEAPSWTSIDFGGVWKVLHYAMADVYRPFHLSAYYNLTTDEVIAHLASDHVENTANVNFTIELIPFDVDAATGADPRALVVETFVVPVVPALSGVFFWKANRTALFESYQDRCPAQGASCFLWLTAKSESGEFLTRSQPFWLTDVRDLHLNNATTVDVRVLERSESEAKVLVSADHVAPYTVLHTDLYYGRFSDNALTVIPGRPIELRYMLRRVQSTAGYRPHLDASFNASLYVECLNQMWT